MSLLRLEYHNPRLNGQIVYDVAASIDDAEQFRGSVNLRDGDSRHHYAVGLAATLGDSGRVAEIESLLAEQLERVKASAPGPVLTRLSTVHPRPVDWLWDQRVPRGKITIVSGDPGTGKSFWSLDVAANVTTGSPWPDDPLGSRREPGSVVLMNCEDDAADTIRPRFDAARGDPDRLWTLDGIRTGAKAGDVRAFTLQDLHALEDALDEARPHLVIIDPVSAYCGQTDSHKNADVRQLMAPITALAARFNAAVILVSHLNKNSGGSAMTRTSGSLAFVAAARAAYVIAKDRTDPARRLWVPQKNNLGNDRDGLAYRIVGDGMAAHLSWESDRVTVTADDVLGAGSNAGGCELDDAIDWLAEVLADGGMESKDVMRQAKANGIGERTVWRAKKDLGVSATRIGFGKGGTWLWALPGAAEPDGPRAQDPLAAYGASPDPIEDIP